MSFARFLFDGSPHHKPAALSEDGKVMNAGYDEVEGVAKVGMMVWNPLSLAWERATASEGGGGGGTVEITTRRIDSNDPLAMYIGDASPGTLESATGWVIKKNVFTAGGDITGVYVASGSWVNRTSLTYL